MKKIKCKTCGKTLLLIDYGRIEIKCPRCKKIHWYDVPEEKKK